MKPTAAPMSSTEFNAATATLFGGQPDPINSMARRLSRDRRTIWRYAAEKSPVPPLVAEIVRAAVKEHQK